MLYTGERFIPNEIPDRRATSISQILMYLEHYHRYLFARRFCKDKKVLDIACGSGYGSFLISQVAKNIIGADIDDETIHYCQTSYQADNLAYCRMSVDDIKADDQTFDVIISFETIEHITAQAQQKALQSFERLLKNDGVLLISTPSRSSELHISDNKYHICELELDDFQALLKQHFKYVNLVGQSVYCCSIIDNNNAHSGAEILHSSQNSAQDNKYVIAICSNQPLDHIPSPSVFIDDDLLMFKKLTKIRNRVG